MYRVLETDGTDEWIVEDHLTRAEAITLREQDARFRIVQALNKTLGIWEVVD